MISRRSEELIAELDRVEWFSRVCVQDSGSARVLNSWDEAIASATDDRRWESFLLDRMADLTVFLHKNAMDRYRKWNEIATAVKVVAEPLVARNIASISMSHKLPKAFEHCVRWDIALACMEAEYSDLRPCAFYTELAGVYLLGHFPCGWDGSYPSGELLVY